MPTGDRVFFGLTNQRVDKKDLEGIAILGQEILSRTVGAFLGNTSGVLTSIPYTWDSETKILSLGAFVAAWGSPRRVNDEGQTVLEPDNYLTGGVLIHDPTRPGQEGNSQIDLNAFSAGTVPIHLFFRREEAASDVDVRAYWPATSEQTAATATRLREIVLFAADSSATGSTEVNPDNGWYRFALFYSPIGLLVPLSVLGDNKGTEALNDLSAGSLMGFNAVGSSAEAEGPWGIGRFAQETISSLLKIRDSAIVIDPATRAITSNPSSTDWRAAPTRGLRQLHTDLTRVTNEVPALLDDYVRGGLNILAEVQWQPNIPDLAGGMVDPVPNVATVTVKSPFLNVTLLAYSSLGGASSTGTVTTGNNAIWWSVRCAAKTANLPFEADQDILPPLEYDRYVITGAYVQYYHPDAWLADDKFKQYNAETNTRARVTELMQKFALPRLVDGSQDQVFKLRFKRPDDLEDVEAPARGWSMIITGYPYNPPTPD